jgi:excisionase family DNA binding protein
MRGPECRYVSPAQIAEHLDVHLRTVRRWIASGTLPSVRIGGVRRVAEADLLQVLEGGRREFCAALPSEETEP